MHGYKLITTICNPKLPLTDLKSGCRPSVTKLLLLLKKKKKLLPAFYLIDVRGVTITPGGCHKMTFDLPPRNRIWACVYVQKLFCIHTQGQMRSVCGLSSHSKQIIALKYNPSSLPLTGTNLKESSVGKIICQGRIESLRRGTRLFFQGSCITMRRN